MKNKEKFHDDIFEIACSGDCVAVDKETGKPINCNRITCNTCLFNTNGLCEDNCKKWCEAEYVEPPVDWSKVAVDTPIYVRDSEEFKWLPRYFAKFEDGRVYAWRDGATSWSSAGHYGFSWKYAKLADRGGE